MEEAAQDCFQQRDATNLSSCGIRGSKDGVENRSEVQGIYRGGAGGGYDGTLLREAVPLGINGPKRSLASNLPVLCLL